MYKIKEIKLTNFKFFFGEKVIKLDRKNALIYGENGSGKSSIYWGIHCFLQSTLKPNIESVQKYFKLITENEESIRNRYAMDDAKNSGILVTLVHEDSKRYEDIRAEVSNQKVSTQTNADIKLMTLTSELINYKVVYNMYLATNKDSIKLFDYFQKNLMEFIDFDQELTTIKGKQLSRNSLEWWRYIEKGIDPYPGIGGDGYWDFQYDVDLFNQKFSDFLQLITEDTNISLAEDFKEDFKIKFRYTNATYNEFKIGEDGLQHGRNRITTAPEIELIVELLNFSGEAAIVERPQSYLNEARLSAIAIAIRFAILKYRYIENAPKVMVLDDLLLSLDLGNRSAILGLLLKKYSQNYQIIMLTHDRALFDCVLNHLSEDDKKHWQILEMYETNEKNKKIPSIVVYETHLAKAFSYFKGTNRPIDYNACGNNQRQALEEIFKKQFKTCCLRDPDSKLTDTLSLMLATCIEKAKQLYLKIKFETEVLDELKIYLKQSLNPSSHHNPQSNFYKSEILRIFEIIEILQNHNIIQLITKDSVLSFNVICEDESEHNYKVKVLDNILAYKKPESDYYFVDSDKYDFQMIEYNNEKLSHKIKSKTLSELYSDTCCFLDRKSKAIRGDNMYNIFKNDGNALSTFSRK